MVGMYFHTTFNLNPRPSSIDTPLHSFLSGKHVDHMHPNAIIAIAASKNCEALTQEIFEGEMEYVPWMRPGFELGLAMQEIEKAKPGTQAIMMGQHGFISWADDDKDCYELTLHPTLIRNMKRSSATPPVVCSRAGTTGSFVKSTGTIRSPNLSDRAASRSPRPSR
jgi:rhamnose utilization protein RhaD (predicted bifunctional aldolase and dehydrogenase)